MSGGGATFGGRTRPSSRSGETFRRLETIAALLGCSVERFMANRDLPLQSLDISNPSIMQMRTRLITAFAAADDADLRDKVVELVESLGRQMGRKG